MNDLRVTADGFVTIGNTNSYYSLEQIQQAVLNAQNPNLKKINTPPAGDGLQVVNLNKPKANAKQPQQEEHLPLPSTLIRNDSQQSHDAACDCEHLPLPSTLRIIR